MCSTQHARRPRSGAPGRDVRRRVRARRTTAAPVAARATAAGGAAARPLRLHRPGSTAGARGLVVVIVVVGQLDQLGGRLVRGVAGRRRGALARRPTRSRGREQPAGVDRAEDRRGVVDRAAGCARARATPRRCRARPRRSRSTSATHRRREHVLVGGERAMALDGEVPPQRAAAAATSCRTTSGPRLPAASSDACTPSISHLIARSSRRGSRKTVDPSVHAQLAGVRPRRPRACGPANADASSRSRSSSGAGDGPSPRSSCAEQHREAVERPDAGGVVELDARA